MPKRSANATVRLAGQDFWYSWHRHIVLFSSHQEIHPPSIPAW